MTLITPGLIYVFMCMHACMCACIYACMCMYVYMNVYMYFYVSLSLFLPFFPLSVCPSFSLTPSFLYSPHHSEAKLPTAQ